jgi:molecular chaperone GrpE
MATEEQKTELLDDFQKYLQQSQSSHFPAVDQPDLNTLLSELTGLKTEVKAESRQFKNTLDTLSASLDTVQESNKRLTEELAASHEQHIQQQNEMMRSILLTLIEVYDRLNAGIDTLHRYQPVDSLFKHSKKKDIRFINRVKEGQIMTVSRFEQLLQHYQVQEIESIGQRLDPLTMIAVNTAKDTTLDNGVVIEELRKGFLYQGQILRLAEVTVNKI